MLETALPVYDCLVTHSDIDNKQLGYVKIKLFSRKYDQCNSETLNITDNEQE